MIILSRVSNMVKCLLRKENSMDECFVFTLELYKLILLVMTFLLFLEKMRKGLTF